MDERDTAGEDGTARRRMGRRIAGVVVGAWRQQVLAVRDRSVCGHNLMGEEEEVEGWMNQLIRIRFQLRSNMNRVELTGERIAEGTFLGHRDVRIVAGRPLLAALVVEVVVECVQDEMKGINHGSAHIGHSPH